MQNEIFGCDYIKNERKKNDATKKKGNRTTGSTRETNSHQTQLLLRKEQAPHTQGTDWLTDWLTDTIVISFLLVQLYSCSCIFFCCCYCYCAVVCLATPSSDGYIWSKRLKIEEWIALTSIVLVVACMDGRLKGKWFVSKAKRNVYTTILYTER